MSTYLTTGWCDGGLFSAEVPSSQITVTCVRLTKQLTSTVLKFKVGPAGREHTFPCPLKILSTGHLTCWPLLPPHLSSSHSSQDLCTIQAALDGCLMETRIDEGRDPGQCVGEDVWESEETQANNLDKSMADQQGWPPSHFFPPHRFTGVTISVCEGTYFVAQLLGICFK